MQAGLEETATGSSVDTVSIAPFGFASAYQRPVLTRLLDAGCAQVHRLSLLVCVRHNLPPGVLVSSVSCVWSTAACCDSAASKEVLP